MTSRDEVDRGNERARDLQSHAPRAISARYDAKTGRIVLNLNSRLIVSVAPQDAEGLETATAAQLRNIEISPSGFAIHFPAIDADIYIPALLEGFLGSKSWMAARLRHTGGQSTSKARKTAARVNGKLGGQLQKGHTPESLKTTVCWLYPQGIAAEHGRDSFNAPPARETRERTGRPHPDAFPVGNGPHR